MSDNKDDDKDKVVVPHSDEEELDEELKPRDRNGDHAEKASQPEDAEQEPSTRDKEPSPKKVREDDEKKEDSDCEEDEESIDTPKPPAQKGEEKHDSSDEGKEPEPGPKAVDDDTRKPIVEEADEKHDSTDEGKEPEPVQRDKDAETEQPTDKDKVDEVIECPLIADILVGRGKQLKQHPGNNRMVAIIAIHRLRYQDANEEEKEEIIAELTSEVQRGGTRFLKVNNNGTGWTKCNAGEVKAKVLECILLGKEDDSDPMARASAAAAGTLGSLGVTAPPVVSLPGVAASHATSPAITSVGGLSTEELLRLRALADPSAASALLGGAATSLPPGLASALDPTKSSQVGAVAEATTSHPQTSLAGLAGILPGDQASLLAELEARRQQSQDTAASTAGGRVNGPPLRTDVVIGKEALLYSQEGNLHLQSLVQANIGQEIIPTEVKRIKAKAIYDRMVLGGARFLMKEVDGSGLWYQLSEAEAQNVVYRGLCEEEKRVQTILISTLQASSLGGGLQLGLNAASLPIGLLSQLGQGGGGDSLLLQNSLTDSLGASDLASDPTPGPEAPKRKYKKRLRRVAEERRKMNLPSAKSSINSMPQSLYAGAGIQDASDSSSERSENEDRDVILRGPIDIRPFDIIMGRGRGSFNHSGNKNLIKIFRESKIPYANSSKNEKIQMARDIVADIQSKGGRFLKRIDDDTWQVISNKDAYKKVGHGIRDLREEDAISVDSEKSASPVTKKRKLGDELESESNKYSRLSSEKKEASDEIRRIVLGEPAPRAEKKAEKKASLSNHGGDYRPSKKAKAHKYASLSHNVDRASVRKNSDEGPTPSFKGYGDGVQPRSLDVVCGRGKAFNRHPANRKMHEAVSRLKYKYRDATSQTEKSEIAHTVLRTIQDDGGKFLKFDEASRGWEELTYKNALKKIYHSIRDSLYNDRSSFGTGEGGDRTIDEIVRRPSASSSKEQTKARKAYELSRAKKMNAAREREMQANNHLVHSQQESRVSSGLMGGNGMAHDPRAYQLQPQQQQHFVGNYPSHGASQYAMNGESPYSRTAEYGGAYPGETRVSEHVSARGGIHGMSAHQLNGSQNAASRHSYPQSHHYPGMGGRY